MIIGCISTITTLTPDNEIDVLQLTNKDTGSRHGLFGWLPTTLTEVKSRQRTQWMLRHPGGGGPLDMYEGEYAVNLDSTFTLLVYFKSDYIPPRIYKTLAALLALEKRDVYLIKSGAFTLGQTPIWHDIYHLSSMDEGFTFVTFEEIDHSAVEVHLHKEPLYIHEESHEEIETRIQEMTEEETGIPLEEL